MKTVRVEIPEGYEIDLEKSNLEKGEISFKKIRGLRWGDLVSVDGWWVNDGSCIIDSDPFSKCIPANRNIFPTKQDAESVLALAQLLQVRKRMIGDWEENWNQTGVEYIITRSKNKLISITGNVDYHELSFPDLQMAIDFREANRDLLEIYFKITK